MYRWVVVAGLVAVIVLAWVGSATVPLPTTSPKEQVNDITTETTFAPAVSTKDEPSPATPKTEEYLVVRVVDGDTIDVKIGEEVQRVRYIGINTPETVHPTRGVECFGHEASLRNKALVEGRRVRLEKDISDTDKYGRLLRYVYVGEVFINEVLVSEGYANVSTYPPDVRYTEIFRAAEATARAERRGLWGADCVPYQSPSSEEGGGQSLPDRACAIKGNIATESGEHIYHVPTCEYYAQTVITEAKGERWFCTEEEAQAAGWRKALNCD